MSAKNNMLSKVWVDFVYITHALDVELDRLHIYASYSKDLYICRNLTRSGFNKATTLQKYINKEYDGSHNGCIR